jgi:hypothetical protein
MLPKTFNVHLRPFQTFAQNVYLFDIHATDREEALSWVERVFVGLDTAPTRKRWENRSTIPKVGNTDPVVIHDCDAFRKSKFVQGVRQIVSAEDGEFRHSETEVANGLYRVFQHLQEDRIYLQDSAKSLEELLEKKSVQGYIGRVELLRQLAQPVLTWQHNLWNEYFRLETARLRQDQQDSQNRQTQPCEQAA